MSVPLGEYGCSRPAATAEAPPSPGQCGSQTCTQSRGSADWASKWYVHPSPARPPPTTAMRAGRGVETADPTASIAATAPDAAIAAPTASPKKTSRRIQLVGSEGFVRWDARVEPLLLVSAATRRWSTRMPLPSSPDDRRG
eukprot:scaffold8106_cov107-Isochrysis_galbana.AAC.9